MLKGVELTIATFHDSAWMTRFTIISFEAMSSPVAGKFPRSLRLSYALPNAMDPPQVAYLKTRPFRDHREEAMKHFQKGLKCAE